jgi:predicted RNA binding protein YcfA (HicA-like mRNA interferase family)
MERQAILERLGWRFVRIRGSEFFLDPERGMRRVFARLEALEIIPEGLEAGSVPQTSTETIDRITRRADELSKSWRENQPDLNAVTMVE